MLFLKKKEEKKNETTRLSAVSLFLRSKKSKNVDQFVIMVTFLFVIHVRGKEYASNVRLRIVWFCGVSGFTTPMTIT